MKNPNDVLIVREYGCCECQRHHVRELDPELYAAHLWRQSKHGPRSRVATPGEAARIRLRAVMAEE